MEGEVMIGREREHIRATAPRRGRRSGHFRRLAGLIGGLLIAAGAGLAQPPRELPPVEPVPAPRPVPPGVLPMAEPEAPRAFPTPGPAGAIRMPRMSDPNMLGATPRPTAKDLEEFNKFIDSVVDPKNTLDLVE